MSLVKKALLSVLGNKVFSAATVESVEDLGPGFRRIQVQGPELRDVQWVPGDKVQLDVGDWNVRTYTPLRWDPTDGRFDFVAYVHGEATPGSRWARTLTGGTPLRLFGPRRSIDVSEAKGPLVIVGDETSLGVACALAKAAVRATVILELSAPQETRAVLEQLGLSAAHLVKKSPDGAHLVELGNAVRELISKDATLVLTGNAKSIQTVRAQLKNPPALTPPQWSKPYWAEGKVGLD